MREEHWPGWDSEAPPTEQLDRPLDEQPALVEELLDGDRVSPVPPSPGKRLLAKVLMAVGGVLAAGVVLYTVDLVLSAGEVPRGVVVAGVDVGGLSRADAEAKLRRELEPRLTEPVPVLAGDVQTTLDPVRSGLGLDWPSTLAQAGHQPLDPLDRLTSFFTRRTVDVVTTVDADALTQAVDRLAAEQLDHPATEGGIVFRAAGDGVGAYAVEPRWGQQLTDLRGAVNLVKTRWLDKSGVQLPMALTPVKATAAGVQAALDNIVRPAVAKPVVLHGEGTDAILTPLAISAAMTITPRDDGSLDVRVDPAKLRQNLQPQLAGTEQDGRDAQIVFTSGAPTVRPSEDGRRVDWAGTFSPLMGVLVKADGRELPVRYRTTKPALTTEAANALGIREVVGEFSTGEPVEPAAANVRAMAAKVDGALVKPGETFSLLARTGSYGAAFVPAPANDDGTGPTVRGGGVSQFATTLYNAAYLAGLTDAGHTPQPYYLDRYPVGRDAAAIRDDGSPVDLKFTNSLNGAVIVQANVTGSTVTVRIWGARQYRVESDTGPRTNFTPPGVEPGPPGCQWSAGSPGFSVSDTRVLYDAATGAEVRRDSTSTTYSARSAVIC
ncbi:MULTISPECIES: VanW family protein [Amycolatopsis]|uniref:VanW family protein n=1 Tax=Amycolatopsis dongchuanensis TaxID=1070866 RepID=A0ABP9Q6M9_9PSEU